MLYNKLYYYITILLLLFLNLNNNWNVPAYALKHKLINHEIEIKWLNIWNNIYQDQKYPTYTENILIEKLILYIFFKFVHIFKINIVKINI